MNTIFWTLLIRHVSRIVKKRLNNTEFSRLSYGKFDAIKRTNVFRPEPPTDEGKNDSFDLKDCILHVDLTKTRFNMDQNNNERPEKEVQLLPSNNRFFIL